MKLNIICFDFKESNIRLQPWRYIYEISTRMNSMDIDVEIISDGYPTLPRKDDIDGITIHRLNHLRSLPFFKNNEIIKLIDKESPNVVLCLIGPTSFYFPTTLKDINKPIIGLWLGTNYSLRQIMDLGSNELIRNFNSLYIHIISALIPSFLIKYVLKLHNLKRIIVLNKNNKSKILDYGISANMISIIPPGIADYNLKLPDMHEIEELRKKIQLDENSFVVLYLGSLLSLRGSDTLINAISIVSKKIPSLKLIILSRRRLDHLVKEENYIKDLCIKKKINDRVEIISGFLDRNDIKKYIILSDLVALPFKLVQSDNPISILEVMALGKPVISTKMDGIPEMLEEDRGLLVNPNDSQDLANAILTLYLNPHLRNRMGERARNYMLKYPTWDHITKNIVTIVNELGN